MNTSPESGKILWIGWGDLAKKSAQAVSVIMNQLGYDVLALDAAEKPVAFSKIEPTELFLRTSKTHHEELVRIAKRDGFDAVYVANYGHQHITSALEFQHSTPLIIVAKPLDTHLDLLLTMSRDHTNFAYLLEKIVAHDHYLNKPGVVFLRKLMPKLHSKHNFLRGAIFFLVERNTIEEKEMHRRKALECGMLFDLAVHMISILQEIVPKSITWYGKGHGTYERRNRRIEVVACITAKDGASLLRASTVMPGREAETFGAIELKVTEEIYHAESRETVEGTFPVLVVVGKGLPGDEGMTRDLKTVVLNFKDGASVTLDLDTYGISGIDQSTLQDAGYDQLEFNQRGINLALILAAQNHFCPGEGGNVFQPYAPALESVRILSEALRRAPAQPVGYGVPSATCRELLNELLLKSDKFSRWDLPGNFGNLLIGAPLSASDVVA